MLSKAFEWSRIVHPTPDDDFVSKRQAVVTALVDDFSKQSEQMIDCACIASIGITPRFTQESPIIAAVIGAIKKEQPATPEALSENLLNVQSCCALVVGEIADRQRKTNGRSANCDAMTSIVLSALAHRRMPSDKHRHEMLTDLLDICRASAKAASEYRHRRYSLSAYINNIKENADFPAFWAEAKKQFVSFANAIASNESVNREELDTVWWAFNGISAATDTPFAEMSVADVALESAGELSKLVLMPPLPNTVFLLRRVLRTGREARDLEDQSLKEQLGRWSKGAAARFADLTKLKEQSIGLAQANPGVFPLTWASTRMAHDESVFSDLRKATGWDPVAKLAPERLAFQAFQEKVSLQLCNNAE